MMVPRILIVEDEPLFASKLTMQIEQIGAEIVAVIPTASGTLEILEDQEVDLILMDIHIKGDRDGVELAELIGERIDIPIIFMTSREDDLTFERAARTGPKAFLVKPFTGIQLKRTIELSMRKSQPNEDLSGELEIKAGDRQTVYIRKRSNIYRVAIDDIYYLEANGRHTRIYTKEEFYLVRKGLKEMLALLPEKKFVRCHRSYVVNMDKVKSVNLKDDLLVLEMKTVPLSKRQKDYLLERMNYI